MQAEWMGYLIISIPILVILAVVFWPQRQREHFFNFGAIKDKFESALFAPPPAPAEASAEPVEGGPESFNPDISKGGDGPMPGVAEVVLPEESAKEKRPMECKFVGAGRSCPVGYEPTGALIGIKGAKMECGEEGPEVEGKAVAVIKGGEIDKVLVVEAGLGYSSAPTVEFIGGGGQGATAEAFIDDQGQLQVIEVVNAGTGFTSTPDILLKTVGNDGCQLCC